MSLINEMLANLDARRPDRRQRHAEELRGLAAPGAVRAPRNLPLGVGACALALATAAVLGLYHFWLRPAVVAGVEPARSAVKLAAAAEPAAPGATAPPAAAQAVPGPPPPPGPAQPEPPPAAQAGGPDPAPAAAPLPAQQRPAAASESRAAARTESAPAVPVPAVPVPAVPVPAVPGAAASEMALDEPAVHARRTAPASGPELAPAAEPAAAADAPPTPHTPLQPTAADERPQAAADATAPSPAPEEIAEFPAEDAPDSLPAGERVARSERPPSARAFAERSYRKGLDLLQSGRGDAAARAFRDALEIDPAHLPAREALVDQLLQAGKLDDASAAVEDARRHGAQEPRIARLAARIALQRGEPQGALEALQRAPQSPDAEYHALLAATYQRLGDAERAAAEYRTLLALEPDRPAHWLGLAIALERRGRGAEALRAYQAARARPGLPEAAARYAADRIASLQRDEE